jgi:arylsulfatase A
MEGIRSRCIVLLAALAAISAAWLAPGGHAAQTAAPAPSFLILLADDLGYGDIAAYGHPHIRTPNLDRLAAQGLRLTDCYAAAPVCSPARAGLLTGRTPNRTGVYDWIPADHPVHLRRGEVTVAGLLRAAGYDTAHVGKWHLNGKFNAAEQPQPGDHGFDHWFATQNNAAPSHENPSNFVRNGKEVGLLSGYAANLVAREGSDWLRGRTDRSRPFYLQAWFHEPHEPVSSPPELVEKYRSVARNADEAQYFANVENMDRAIGELLRTLDDLGAAENTLVFFTSDNGPETLRRYRGAERSYGTPGPLRGMKLHLYEGGIRVPGILRWPARIQAGQVSAEPVSAVDLLPTVCDLRGIPLPANRPIDGASIAPVFSGKPVERRVPLFWAYYRSLSLPKVAMRDGDWKLVAHWDGPEDPLGGNVNPQSMRLIKTARLTRFELYNLREDPGETRDLAASQPDRLKTLSQRLLDLYLEVQAEGVDWEFSAEEN